MSRLLPKIYRFPPSISPDVVNYRLYHKLTEGPWDYDGEYIDLSVPPTAEHNGVEKIAVDLTTTFPNFEGAIDVAIVAEDSAGNLADFGSEVLSVPLDFKAPEATGPGEVSNA